MIKQIKAGKMRAYNFSTSFLLTRPQFLIKQENCKQRMNVRTPFTEHPQAAGVIGGQIIYLITR